MAEATDCQSDRNLLVIAVRDKQRYLDPYIFFRSTSENWQYILPILSSMSVSVKVEEAAEDAASQHTPTRNPRHRLHKVHLDYEYLGFFSSVILCLIYPIYMLNVCPSPSSTVLNDWKG